MTENELLSMFISAVVVLAGLCAAIIKPISSSNKQMQKLTNCIFQIN